MDPRTAGQVTAIEAAAVRFATDNFLRLLPGVEGVEFYTELAEKIETLSSKLTATQAVLGDAAEQQLKGGHAVRGWLQKLKDAACDVEDVLDSFNTELLHRRSRVRVSMKVLDFFTCHRVAFRIGITSSIETVNRKLDLLMEEKKFQLPLGTMKRREDPRITGSYINSSEIIGRDDDKQQIARFLFENSGSERVSVIGIFGLGGIGKTTLAQEVCNDKDVREHFGDLVMWKFVGHDVNDSTAKTLTTSILELATKRKPESLEIAALQHDLREALAGKTFLLVLDDVWNVDGKGWNSLKDMLQSGAEGSKLIVTTRHEDTLQKMGASNCHRLGPLCDEHCLLLFKRFAFGPDEENYTNLASIGKEIVKKCRGVPLAAIAMGSMMRFKQDKSEWLDVLESEIWELPEDEDEILPALKLSYIHLTTESRPCFAFCAVFPKGYEIDKENLIQLWMANNLIRPTSTQDVEAVGHKVFTDLVWRSFFQEEKKDADGNTSKCKMHDLMHGLARQVAGNECHMLGFDNLESIQRRTRYMSIWQSSSADISEALLKPQSLRTLLQQKTGLMDRNVLICVFTKLRFLRVLDLSGGDFKEFPVSVDRLKHLRYLSLSKSSIITLPNSIDQLQNLQSLILSQCNLLRELPKNLKKLQNLRHLDISGCRCLTHMPSGLAQLSCLRKLTDFVVGKETGCSIQELRDLKLYDDLYIYNLENINNEEISENKILNNKQHLKSLRLYWKYGANSFQNIEKLLEFLEPHSTLKRLNVSNYGGRAFPLWLANLNISELVEIKLINCRSCEHLPQLGNLQHLKEIQIIGMESVKNIDENFYGSKYFPSLVQLSLYNMPNLEQWIESQEHDVFPVFPILKTITIGLCPRLMAVPRIAKIQRFEMSQCHANLLTSVGALTSLSSLLVMKTRGSTSMPNQSLQHLTLLTKLDLIDCTELESLPGKEMQHLIHLQDLNVAGCMNIKSFPLNLEQMTSLQTLHLQSCINLGKLPHNLDRLNSLKSLKIVACRSITSWPETVLQKLNSVREFQIEVCGKKVDSSGWLHRLQKLQMLRIYGEHFMRPTSLLASKTLSICCFEDIDHLMDDAPTNSFDTILEELVIENFLSLRALPGWVAQVRSLRYVSIHKCPQLATLPEWFQNLSKLQVLTIQGCSELQNRCKRENGADWQNISHVPVIQIGSAANDAHNSTQIATGVSDTRNLPSIGSLISCFASS